MGIQNKDIAEKLELCRDVISSLEKSESIIKEQNQIQKKHKKEAIIESIHNKQPPSDESLVSGTNVFCTSASPNDFAKMIKVLPKSYLNVKLPLPHEKGLSKPSSVDEKETNYGRMKRIMGANILQQGIALNHKDVLFSPFFKVCAGIEGGKCLPKIQNNRWQVYDRNVRYEEDGDKTYGLLKNSSFMICQSGKGIIHAFDNGQKLSELVAIHVEGSGKGQGKVIAIDPGHGIETPGKRTPTFSDGTMMKELEFNKAVAEYLIPLLNKEEFSVLNVAESDYGSDINGVSNTDRVNLANNTTQNVFNNPADLYISIHANAHGDGNTFNNAEGVETYIHPSDSGTTTEEFRKIVHKHIINNNYGQKDRGFKTANFQVIRDTNMPAILVEAGFMTNEREARLLMDEDFRMKFAENLYHAIIEISNQL